MQYTDPNVAITDLTKNDNEFLLKLNHNIDFNFEPNDLVKVKSDIKKQAQSHLLCACFILLIILLPH